MSGTEGERLRFQERRTVISECFFALSGCLTKTGGGFFSQKNPPGGIPVAVDVKRFWPLLGITMK